MPEPLFGVLAGCHRHSSQAAMNYDILNKLIPARRTPCDVTAPRARLYELFRDLAELRDAASAMAEPTPEIERQIRFYERILEQ